MDSQFWKVFGTLFGIGAAVSFAKSLKAKKKWPEILSEMIITGFLATSAALLMVWKPEIPMPAVAGGAALLSILGVAFLSDKLEKLFEKYVIKKEDNGS